MCPGVAECFGDVDLNFKSVVKSFFAVSFLCVSIVIYRENDLGAPKS